VFGRPRRDGESTPSGTLKDRGGKGAEQERLIRAALAELHDRTVREVMTPRVDVEGLAIPVHASDVARAVQRSGHSCFPVFDEDLDRLIGILYVNDIFRAGWDIEARNGDATGSAVADRPTPLDISRQIRQPFLVPESRLVLDVLADMRQNRRAFAVVVDEYGGVAGVVSVKDLLSALVGDLRDEFDPGGEPDVIRVDQTRWLVDGGATLDEVAASLALELPEGEYVTFGGYLLDALGHIPEEGEVVTRPRWEFRVVEMDKRRIAKVVARTMAAGDDEDDEDHDELV
jgi:CBS domain containing-hemolysin-like protein